MREITREMIKEYRLMKLGYDFMGYEIKNKQDLSFHHLIVPRRNCKALGLGEGYLKWNGSILNQNTSHDYLHLIEAKDLDMFIAITIELLLIFLQNTGVFYTAPVRISGVVDVNLQQINGSSDAFIYKEKWNNYDEKYSSEPTIPVTAK